MSTTLLPQKPFSFPFFFFKKTLFSSLSLILFKKEVELILKSALTERQSDRSQKDIQIEGHFLSVGSCSK